MNNKIFALTLMLTFVGISSHATTAESAGTDSCADITGNSFAGRLFCDTGKTSVPSCSGCHGDDGNSMATSFPKLAGQNAKYISAQLMAFKNGDRSDPSMQGIAQTMNQANMHEIGEFYAKINISAHKLTELDEDDEEDLTAPMDELMVIGKNVYQHGNKASEVPACQACHGATGEGNTPAGYPALASQHAAYLIKTLTDFKAGARSSDPDNMMAMITDNMSAQEIEAVAYYLSVMK